MKNGDQPAAPLKTLDGNQGCEIQYPGFTKREVIADMAMQGLLSNSNIIPDDNLVISGSVKMADLLLAELEKTNQ